MYNHAPHDYICPICSGVNGIKNSQTLIRSQDIVYQDKLIAVFIASFFIKGSEGHLIVVPKQHYENLYDLPDNIGASIFQVSRHMATVMKRAYKCQGVTVLQNNEPASGQHAFHYHLHLFPRYPNDHLHQNMANKQETTTVQRLPFIQKIKARI